MAFEKALPGYETTVVTRNEMTDDALKTLKDRLTAIVVSFGGEIVEIEDWGKKRLAFPIKKESRGQYTYLAYTGKPGVVAELERNLRIHEHVLRYLTVNLDAEFDAGAFRTERAALKTRREEAVRAAAEYESGYDA